jgi:hypothetical protein
MPGSGSSRGRRCGRAHNARSCRREIPRRRVGRPSSPPHNLPAWKVSEAQTIAHFRGWAPIIAVQLEYSLLERTAEGELFPMAQAMGMGIMPWKRRGAKGFVGSGQSVAGTKEQAMPYSGAQVASGWRCTKSSHW